MTRYHELLMLARVESDAGVNLSSPVNLSYPVMQNKQESNSVGPVNGYKAKIFGCNIVRDRSVAAWRPKSGILNLHADLCHPALVAYHSFYLTETL